ncbi:hypothetical protein EJ04DRAFT_578370 [Polyplosphaeria fusca]|uniref:Uncharacterized protein n=1 Tax=Polyplosphaeria fusca TaxID=682080 RepID=A0A9P4QWW6_9PLEO|nr:hypothetical protein EJ04DRAFT_578370 [Polyplosphaeria fusca]
MLSKTLTFAALSTAVLAAEFYSPANTFGAMMKRQGGYHPTTHLCGQGETCQEACGPTYVQCPSDSGLYCYDESQGYHCCPDGTGNSCKPGYYCTSDGAGATYCCPDGMSTSDCAAAYSLTVSLISLTEAPVPTSESSGSPAVTPVSTTPIHVSYPSGGTTAPVYPTGNATFTTASPSQFTGAAAKVVGGGMAVLAGAAGIAGFL